MLTEQKSGIPKNYKKLVKSREYSNESTALTKKTWRKHNNIMVSKSIMNLENYRLYVKKTNCQTYPNALRDFI